MGATRLTFIGENAMFTQKNKDSQTALITRQSVPLP